MLSGLCGWGEAEDRLHLDGPVVWFELTVLSNLGEINLFVECFSIRNLKKYEKKDGEQDAKKEDKKKDKKDKKDKNKGKDGKVKKEEEETEGSRKRRHHGKDGNPKVPKKVKKWWTLPDCKLQSLGLLGSGGYVL